MIQTGSNDRTVPASPIMPRINWRIAIASMAALVLVFATLSIPVSNAPAAGRLFATIQPQLFMWGLWLLLLPLVFAVSQRAHELGVFTTRAMLVHVVAGAGISLLHGVLWGILRWYLSTSPNRDLDRMIAAIVSFVYGGDVLRYAAIACVYHALAFRAEVRERMLSESRLAARLAEARLDALEARLHPHFLFNTLNTITALIRKDPPSAIAVVENLGDLLRAALRNEPGREVTLSAELDLLGRYVAIQRARFPDRLTVNVRAAPDALAASVPQLLLQPFVENAIQHGLAPREAAGTVTILAERIGERLRLTIGDDGVGFGRGMAPTRTSKGNGTGIGITNSRARLEETYGTRFALDIAPVEPTGTLVTIEIPFRTATS